MGVKIKSTGGGSVTLDVPSTASDFLLNLPAVGGNVVTTGDSGTITPTMLNGGQTGSAPGYVCRAWVNFNGGGTVTIRGSGNVTSITDNGTGDYTLNFTNAMVDANYSVVGTTGFNTTSLRCLVLPFNQFPQTSSSVRIQMPASDGSISSDVPIACVAVFR